MSGASDDLFPADVPWAPIGLCCRICSAEASHLVEYTETGCLCVGDKLQSLCTQHVVKGMEAAHPHGRIVAVLGTRVDAA